MNNPVLYLCARNRPLVWVSRGSIDFDIKSGSRAVLARASSFHFHSVESVPSGWAGSKS